MPEDYKAEYAHWRYQDLPIIPEKWKYNISPESAKQFDIVSSLMKDERVDGIICATDARREGELIFLLVYQIFFPDKAAAEQYLRTRDLR